MQGSCMLMFQDGLASRKQWRVQWRLTVYPTAGWRQYRGSPLPHTHTLHPAPASAAGKSPGRHDSFALQIGTCASIPCLCCRYINGQHYSKTLEDWLKLHDGARSSILPLFEQTYGKAQVGGWVRLPGAACLPAKSRLQKAEPAVVSCSSHSREYAAFVVFTHVLPRCPPVQALKWFVYWRLFYLACSELFAYRGGNEWGVVSRCCLA